MLRKPTTWAMCFAALALASGTTSADVVMSQSNNPTALMTDQLSSVMSIEREAFKAIANRATCTACENDDSGHR